MFYYVFALDGWKNVKDSDDIRIVPRDWALLVMKMFGKNRIKVVAL